MDVFAYIVVGIIVAFFALLILAGVILLLVAISTPFAVAYEAVKKSKDSHRNA